MIRTTRSAAPEPSPKPVPRVGLAREDAETLAIEALGFIAADSELLGRFLAVTGIEAADIRRAAASPGFLAGTLAFVAAHEPTLVAFAAAAGRKPDAVAAALRALPQGDDRFDRST